MGITQQIFFSPGFFAIQKSFQSWNFGVWEIIEVFLFHNFEKYLLLKTNCSIYNCSNRIVLKWNEFFFSILKNILQYFRYFLAHCVSIPHLYILTSNISILSFSRESMLFKKSVVDHDLVLIFGDSLNRKNALAFF